MASDQAALDVSDLRFRYSAKSRELFDGLSFRCLPGTLTLIEGENGAGKSTLMRLCADIRTPTSGTIERHAKVAYLPQSSGSLNPQLTGSEHIQLFGAALGISADESMARAQRVLADLLFRNSPLDAPIGKLSGGNRQKLSMALALMDTDATLWLLDEPYTGFDTPSFSAFIEMVSNEVRDDGTVVMVNHIADPRLPVDQVIQVGAEVMA